MTKKQQEIKVSILITFIAFIIISTIILVITAFKLNTTSEVEILVTPISSTLTINGKPYKNGTFRVPNGELNIKIEKDGFVTQEFTFDSSKNSKLYAYLQQSDGKYTWYEQHEEDALLLNTIGGFLAIQSSSNYEETHPIIKELPIIFAEYDKEYNYTEFRIDGGYFKDCPIEFCLKITDTTGNNKEKAYNLIKQKGFNPKDYHILYEYKPITPLE